jgi:ABC-type nitrate/sulfonate/bicarbonate transport system ATPase subunit
MAFQNPVLLEWRTILKNVILPLEIVPPECPGREKPRRARALLALVGLEGFEDKRPSELSGGMRQRASLCRARAQARRADPGRALRRARCLHPRGPVADDARVARAEPFTAC